MTLDSGAKAFFETSTSAVRKYGYHTVRCPDSSSSSSLEGHQPYPTTVFFLQGLNNYFQSQVKKSC